MGEKSELDPRAIDEAPSETANALPNAVMRERAELEVRMLDEARGEVVMADQKASMILAAAGIGFAAVLGGFLSGDWKPSDYNSAGEFLWWLGAFFAFGVVLLNAIAVWPRFTTRDEDGLVTYWGHVARYSRLDQFEAALEASPVDPPRTRHQLWRLARIVRTKYICVRLGLVSGGIAATLFVLAGLVGTAPA